MQIQKQLSEAGKINRGFLCLSLSVFVFCNASADIMPENPRVNPFGYNFYVTEDNDTIPYKELNNVTVNEKLRVSGLKSGAPFQIMNEEELTAMGTPSLSDAVKRFAGVTVKDYGGIGGLKVVSVRGMGAEHTGVCYDGVNISNCQSGQIDISRFSLDNVSQLSLAIGQNDDIFNSAKTLASGGMLFIETRNPLENNDKPIDIKATFNTGSYNMLNGSLIFSQKITKALSYSVHGSYLHAKGDYDFKIKNGKNFIEGTRNNSDIDSYQAELNVFGNISQKQTLNGKLYYYYSDRGLPGSVIIDNAYSVERLYDKNCFAQLRYLFDINSKFKLKANAKYNYTWSNNTDVLVHKVYDDKFKQNEAYATAILLYTPLKGLSFSAAQDFTYNYLSTNLDECPFPRRYNWQTAVNGQYEAKWFTLTASLLNTFIKETVESGNKPKDLKRLSPAFGISVKPFDFTNLRIRLAYKDIYRVPTFNDMYYLRIGNTNLKPEKAKQLNAGITWIGNIGDFIDYLSISSDFYYNKVEDKIVAFPTMFIWKMMNLSTVKMLGADVKIFVSIPVTDKINIDLSGVYNYMKAKDRTDKNSKIWGHQIPYTPLHSGSGDISLKMPWINVGYNIIYASERYRLNENIKGNIIDGYTDQSVWIDRKFDFKKHSLRLKFQALNLSDKNYEIIRYYPMAGRNYRLTINYQY